METECGLYGNSVLSVQLFYKSKTVIKYKVSKKKKKGNFFFKGERGKKEAWSLKEDVQS